MTSNLYLYQRYYLFNKY